MDYLLVLLPVALIVVIAVAMLLRGGRQRSPRVGVPPSWVAWAAVGGIGTALLMAVTRAEGGRIDWWYALTIGMGGFAIGLVALLLIDRLGHPQS